MAPYPQHTNTWTHSLLSIASNSSSSNNESSSNKNLNFNNYDLFTSFINSLLPNTKKNNNSSSSSNNNKEQLQQCLTIPSIFTQSYFALFIFIGLLVTSSISLFFILHVDDLELHNTNNKRTSHFPPKIASIGTKLRSKYEKQMKSSITFQYNRNDNNGDQYLPISLQTFKLPPISKRRHQRYGIEPDYGTLKISPILNFTQGRIIKEQPLQKPGHVYNYTIDGDDYVEAYYAFDDDRIRHPTCRRLSWHRMNHPNCNSFHETNSKNVVLINSGYYRNVMKLKDSFSETVIFKTIRLVLGYEYDSYEYTRMDALVMERLTSSPRIADIYGHCGTSIIQEAFVKDVENQFITREGGYQSKVQKLYDENDAGSTNYLSPIVKLQSALTMAEAIADLHGYLDGVIVHDDIQLGQFLTKTDGTIKLNDFNRAEIMLWDETNQAYCRYRNGVVYGIYRAPEEMKSAPLNEKIDVWSLGNNFYSLLTGLPIFYYMDNNQDDIDELQKNITQGETSFIDPRYKTRSYAEGVLASVIEKCWIYDPDDRVNIFEIVDILKNALQRSSNAEFS